jgi:hypothetical protein
VVVHRYIARRLLLVMGSLSAHTEDKVSLRCFSRSMDEIELI